MIDLEAGLPRDAALPFPQQLSNSPDSPTVDPAAVQREEAWLDEFLQDRSAATTGTTTTGLPPMNQPGDLGGMGLGESSDDDDEIMWSLVSGIFVGFFTSFLSLFLWREKLLSRSWMAGTSIG